jgi:hypothetical protein
MGVMVGARVFLGALEWGAASVARANRGPRVAFFVPIRAESDYFVVSLQPKQALWEKEN